MPTEGFFAPEPSVPNKNLLLDSAQYEQNQSACQPVAGERQR